MPEWFGIERGIRQNEIAEHEAGRNDGADQII